MERECKVSICMSNEVQLFHCLTGDATPPKPLNTHKHMQALHWHKTKEPGSSTKSNITLVDPVRQEKSPNAAIRIRSKNHSEVDHRKRA